MAMFPLRMQYKAMAVHTSQPKDCIQFAATRENDFGIFIATITANGAERKTLVT